MYILKRQYRPNIVLSIEVNKNVLAFHFVCPFSSLFSVSPCVFLFSSLSDAAFLYLSHSLSIFITSPAFCPPFLSLSLSSLLFMLTSSFSLDCFLFGCMTAQ